jgi:hypothetical protein
LNLDVLTTSSIFNIITTNKNKTITAPTYTKIRTIAKNSACNNNHSAALVIKLKMSDIAEYTGFLNKITPRLVRTNIDAKT